MTDPVRSIHQLSDQDFGAFVQEADYYFFPSLTGNKHLLRVAADYQEADTEAWYELEEAPTKWPEDDGETWADPHRDQSEKNVHGESDLSTTFGVHGTTTELRPS